MPSLFVESLGCFYFPVGVDACDPRGDDAISDIDREHQEAPVEFVINRRVANHTERERHESKTSNFHLV